MEATIVYILDTPLARSLRPGEYVVHVEREAQHHYLAFTNLGSVVRYTIS